MKTSHPLTPDDGAFIGRLKTVIKSGPALALVPEARELFDALISSMTPPAENVSLEPGSVGGIDGWWCKPNNALKDSAILFLHGGGYVLGSAASSRNLASHFALQSGADVFVADYARAPEAPFPAALNDCIAVFRGLQNLGRRRVAVVGESAGGGLALLLLSSIANGMYAGELAAPVGAVALSPWIDLALKSRSMETRRAEDPFLSQEALRAAAKLYLGAKSAEDAGANALFSASDTATPVQIHVGEDEVLLDDSVRYVEKLNASGGRGALHVWEGMVHVFQMHVGKVKAADQSLNQAAQFLAERLSPN